LKRPTEKSLPKEKKNETPQKETPTMKTSKASNATYDSGSEKTSMADAARSFYGTHTKEGLETAKKNMNV
jgi:hypothetical protein